MREFLSIDRSRFDNEALRRKLYPKLSILLADSDRARKALQRAARARCASAHARGLHGDINSSVVYSAGCALARIKRN